MASVLSSKHHSIECIVDYSPDELPDEFSWVDQGVVTSVKNQGHCGSCYAFAAISALESQYLIHYEDDNVDLSEQAMIDCVSNGCSGGHSYNVYDYIKEEGVPEEEEVPYLEEVLFASKKKFNLKQISFVFRMTNARVSKVY